MKYIITISVGLFFSVVSSARYQRQDEASHKYNFINQYFKVKKDGSFKLIEEREIEILNETGRKDFGFQKLNYAPNTDSLKLLEAYTVTNGKKIKVSSELIEDKPIASQITGFDLTNQVAITFPDVKVGSKIYLKYSFEKKIPTLKNVFSNSEFFGWKENIQKQNLYFESEMELFYYLNDPDQDLQLEGKKENNLYYLNLALVKPSFFNPIEEKDPYMQRTTTPYIEVSSEKKWSYSMLEPVIIQNELILAEELPEKMSKIVIEAKKLSGFLDRVNYLIKEIQESIRYFGDWRPIKGALIPRNLELIMETGFGDCKDYSALLTVMLRKLGYDSHIAWVYRAYPYIPYDIHMPSLSSYNHAITFVSYENKEYWFDPTNNMVFTQEPLSDISNRNAVILAKDESIFKFIPKNDPNKNSDKTSITYSQWKKDEVSVNVTIEVRGIPASHWAGSELSSSKSAIENDLLEWVTNSVRNTSERHFEPFDLTSRITRDYKFQFSFKEKNSFLKSNYGKAFTLWQNKGLKLIGEETENRETDLFLRSPRVTIYKFKFEKAFAKNFKSLECKINSNWIDISREAKNPKSGLEIEDMITLKKSYIYRNEFESAEFKKVKSKIRECLLGKVVVLQ